MTIENLPPLKQALKLISLAIFNWGQKVGDISQLRTNNKSSVVEAINELQARQIPQGDVNESRVNELITEKISAITNGASDAFDTLKEIEDHLSQNQTAAQGILTEIAGIKSTLNGNANLPEMVRQLLDTGVYNE